MGMPPVNPTPFVVLFPGRTGSSWLISCLDSHPAIEAEGERLVRRSPRSQRGWIERFYGRRRRGGVLARGFKTKLKDVWDLDAFRHLLQERGVRVVVLDRRNTIKLAVSTINARRLHERTGRWNRSRDTAALPPFELEPADLERELDECRELRERLAAFADTLELPRLALCYEDLLTDPEGRLAEIMAFLDVPPAPLASEVVKNTDDDLSRVLANHDALREHFAGGPHGAMFDRAG
ncbi:MAG: sulfotransferase [Planctomycetes bacterium]|nr:sulfotransferase [Planctomycetota bacterium]